MPAKKTAGHRNLIASPGKTILETMKSYNLSAQVMAYQMGTTVDVVEGLVTGRCVITEEIAQQLEKVLLISATFWLSREKIYRDSLTPFDAQNQRDK